MKKLINPIILAGFIYTIAVHVIRFHWRSIALFLVPLLVGVGIISILNWIISPTIEEIASLIRESEKKHEEAGDGIEIANDCSHVTALNAICVDRVQRGIYVGTGTSVVEIDSEKETSSIDDVLHKAHEISEIGDTILLNEGYDSDARSNPVVVLDENNDGFLVYTSASGPIMECVKGYGTEHERPCEEYLFIGPKPLVDWQK